MRHRGKGNFNLTFKVPFGLLIKQTNDPVDRSINGAELCQSLEELPYPWDNNFPTVTGFDNLPLG